MRREIDERLATAIITLVVLTAVTFISYYIGSMMSM